MKQKILKVGKIILALFLIISILSMSLSFIRKDTNDDDISDDIGTTKQPIKSPLAGKYISFLGDSITTYEGWSNSTAFNSTLGENAVYYNSASGLSVNDTWWKQLIDTNGMRLCVNNSWSAARLSARNDPVIPSAYERCSNLDNSKGISPDIIIIYLGTNDVANNATLSNATVYDAMEAYNAGYNCLEENPVYSLVYTVMQISESFEADIFLCTLLPESRNENAKAYLDHMNEQIRYFDGYRDRVHVVDLYNNTGITYDNYMNYTIDDGTMRVHPNKAGMDLITNCVQATFERVYGF